LRDASLVTGIFDPAVGGVVRYAVDIAVRMISESADPAAKAPLLIRLIGRVVGRLADQDVAAVDLGEANGGRLIQDPGRGAVAMTLRSPSIRLSPVSGPKKEVI
jgi:hypothetical protein